MKNKMLSGIIISSLFFVSILFLVSCTPIQDGPYACTMDAKICPDGTAVGRSGPNCEFEKCPDVKIGNPASAFCEEKGGVVRIITEPDGSQRGECVLADSTICDEWAYFRGECNSNSTSQPSCTCPQGFVKDEANSDVCNPTCYYNTPRCLAPSIQCTPEKPVIFTCTAEEKAAQICTMEYNPVCGYFNSSIQCIKYPCAETYGNKCTACADEKVAYYEQGECPK